MIISGNIVITEMYSNYEHLGVNVLLYYIYIILCCIKYYILYYSSFVHNIQMISSRSKSMMSELNFVVCMYNNVFINYINCNNSMLYLTSFS